MRTTPYGEPSDKEIDSLRIPPTCPQCGEPSEEYDEPCESCLTDPDQDGKETAFQQSTSDLFKP
jgi:predicted amidophosphoribosyltransferase